MSAARGFVRQNEPDRFAEINAHGVAGVASAMELERVGPKGYPCPLCGDVRRHRKTGDKRGAIGVRTDGKGWSCFQCGATGDPIRLAALIVLGKEPAREDWPKVFEACAVRGLCSPLLGARSSTWKPRPLPTPAPIETMPYPDPLEVEALWRACVPVLDDEEATRWLGEVRGLDVGMLELFDLARVLPKNLARSQLPEWAQIGKRTWIESGHRIVAQVFDEFGNFRSVRACFIGTCKVKRVPPKGRTTTGLVLANSMARQLLRTGALPSTWTKGEDLEVLVCEGEPDFWLRASEVSDADETPRAVFGVFAGAWSQAIADRIPSGALVFDRIHGDNTGASYSEKLRNTLANRCPIYRKKKGEVVHGETSR